MAIGVLFLNEALHAHVIIGSALVVGPGLYTVWRERMTRTLPMRNASG